MASEEREVPLISGNAPRVVHVGDSVRRPLNPGSKAPSASPGLMLLEEWPPTAGLVQHALFGQE